MPNTWMLVVASIVSAYAPNGRPDAVAFAAGSG